MAAGRPETNGPSPVIAPGKPCRPGCQSVQVLDLAVRSRDTSAAQCQEMAATEGGAVYSLRSQTAFQRKRGATTPMKLSEKSLELNVGAELLWLIRGPWGMPKAYLRGLTQREERQEGVDFFVQLDQDTRVFAFQFKAPKGAFDGTPYRYNVVKQQHERLFDLAQIEPDSVFYVFPFYVTPTKLQQDIPQLLQDTWLADVGLMPTGPLFGPRQTRTINCTRGQAFVNPEYPLANLATRELPKSRGIPVKSFVGWYARFLEDESVVRKRRSPWLARGLRLALVVP